LGFFIDGENEEAAAEGEELVARLLLEEAGRLLLWKDMK